MELGITLFLSSAFSQPTNLLVQDVRGDLQEECRGWDVNELVFSAALWPVYHSIMRSDFSLFDQYEYTHQGKTEVPSLVVPPHLLLLQAPHAVHYLSRPLLLASWRLYPAIIWKTTPLCTAW